MKQRTREWHEARNKCSVTGSTVSKILGNNPWGSIDDALREKVRAINGAKAEFTGNIATQWGEDHEAEAIQQYEIETGNLVEEHGFFVHTVFDWIGYSPDGTSEDVLIEVKCPYNQKVPASVPAHYLDQVQLGMEVMRLRSCDFIYWTPLGIKVFHVERDPAWMHSNIDRLVDFNEKVMLGLDDPSHLEPKVKDMEGVDEWTGLAKAYRRAEEEKKEAELRMKALKDAMIEVAGGVSARGSGVTLTHVFTQGSVQYKDIPMIQEMSDEELNQYRAKSRESWRLTKEKA